MRFVGGAFRVAIHVAFVAHGGHERGGLLSLEVAAHLVVQLGRVGPENLQNIQICALLVPEGRLGLRVGLPVLPGRLGQVVGLSRCAETLPALVLRRGLRTARTQMDAGTQLLLMGGFLAPL